MTTQIIKSPKDERKYQGLQLENGLKVLLVSDPSTDKSAASLDVHIGHMSDPHQLPGLAHFCEHMLFLGTEKYPDENDYNKFLTQNGGCFNAYTSQDHTNYHFDVSSKHLKGALDRFGQFFLKPLFTESATDREVRAVNSEHEKNIPSDTWRLNQLDKALSDPTHDYAKFGTGNLKTLDTIPKSKGISVRDELLKFHGKWYSSNIMSLVVLGSETLPELKTLVEDLFSEVVNKSVTIPSWPKHPYLEKDNNTITYVVPITDIRNLSLTFPIMDLEPFYRTGPGRYLSHLIGHEGKGSLLSELKAQGWVNSLAGGERSGAKGFSFFTINVDLTESGMDHINDIVCLMFQYLNMLRKVGPQEWVFNECRDLHKMWFHFKDKERPISFVSSTSRNIHDYPLEECLYGPFVMEDWKPELINSVLEKLTPNNCRLSTVSQAYKDIATEVEDCYGTKYVVKMIEKDDLERWENCGLNDNLKMPEKNEFIPTNFDIVKEVDPSTVEEHPLIIKENELCRLWFKQDDKFLLPKANLFFEFKMPLVYSDPLNANLASLMVALFKDDINECVYMAEISGLGYLFSNTKDGLNLNIRGYNEKQGLLLEKFISRMVNFKVNPVRFEILKEAYVRTLRNFETNQPHHLANYYSNSILCNKFWHKWEMMQVVDDITVEEMNDFIPRLWKNIHIVGLIHGNVSKERALELLAIIENALPSNVKPLMPLQLYKDREINFKSQSHQIYEATTKFHSSSSIECYYQCGSQGTRSNVILELFCQIVNEPCFNILRTKEQLGYIVHSGVRRASAVQGFRVIVQSDRHPDYLDTRVEAFLNHMRNFILELSDEEFQRNKDALADRRLEKPKKLSTLSYKFWLEISSHQYNFNRDHLEVEALKSVTKEDVIEFFDNHLGHNSANRKKLGIHMTSIAEGGVGLEKEFDMKCSLSDAIETPKDLPQYTVIKNIHQFKAQSALHPLAKPMAEIETFKKQ